MTAPDLDDELEPGRFRDFQPRSYPPWLQHPKGYAWGRAFGMMKDAIADGAMAAVRARIVMLAPDDGLAYLGADLQIERGPGESADSYRARLQRAIPAWEKAGSDAGVVEQLAAIGLTARVKRNNQWDWDGHPGNVAPWWARMWVIIDRPNPFGPPLVCGGGAVCGDGSLCGMTDVSADLVALIRRIVKKWTSSHARVVNVIVMTSDGWLCGDGHTCGSGGTCGGSAAYLEGW